LSHKPKAKKFPRKIIPKAAQNSSPDRVNNPHKKKVIKTAIIQIPKDKISALNLLFTGKSTNKN